MKIHGVIGEGEAKERELRRVLRGKCNGFIVERTPGMGSWITIYGIGIVDYLKIRKSLQSL